MQEVNNIEIPVKLGARDMDQRPSCTNLMIEDTIASLTYCRVQGGLPLPGRMAERLPLEAYS